MLNRNIRKTVTPAIPAVSNRPEAIYQAVGPMKEAIEIMQGQRGTDFMDAVVRWRDLVDLGLIGVEQVPRKS